MHGTLRLTAAALLAASVLAGAAMGGAKIGERDLPHGGRPIVAKPAILTPGAGTSAALTSAEQREIETVVRVQLLALARLDAKLAFDRLAPSTQRYFEKPERYLAILAMSVAPILQMRHFTFLGSERTKDRTVQQVLIADESGSEWLAEFEVVRERGDWRVKSCVVEPAPGQQA